MMRSKQLLIRMMAVAAVAVEHLLSELLLTEEVTGINQAYLHTLRIRMISSLKD